MATASSLAARARINAFDNVAASQTDSVLVAAQAGRRIRVTSVAISCGATPSSVTFNSKPTGAGVAISPTFANSAVLPDAPAGHFQTGRGEGLTVTTGAGSTTGILVVFEVD